MLKPACALVVGASALGASCAPAPPPRYADHDAVVEAQKKWCATLAKVDEKEIGSWRYREGCLAAYPSSSAAYLSRLADCYAKTFEDYGKDVPDSAAIIDACTTEILAAASPGDVTGTELFEARCAQLERCSQVGRETCLSAWERVDPASQALLTSMYNFRAQSEIAACLREGACGESEDALERACYQKAKDERAWLPISLAADPTLGPAVR